MLWDRDKVGIWHSLDLIVLEVFSNRSDSVVLSSRGDAKIPSSMWQELFLRLISDFFSQFSLLLCFQSLCICNSSAVLEKRRRDDGSHVVVWHGQLLEIGGIQKRNHYKPVESTCRGCLINTLEWLVPWITLEFHPELQVTSLHPASRGKSSAASGSPG